jgi:outer membrane beta-barrel protein
MPRKLLCVIALISATAAHAQDAVPPPVVAPQEPGAQTPAGEDGQDTITAVQKRPLRQAKRLEISPYGEMSLGDPYLQRWGGGLRVMYHLREGLSLGLDGVGFGTYRTQELVIARTELHANVIESREKAALLAFAAIAPIYGKVALPGDALVHFETFLDLGMGGALTETDATSGVRPMLSAGIGQRIFLNESFALTARVGGNVYAERVLLDAGQQTKLMGFWSLRLGLSYYLGGGR